MYVRFGILPASIISDRVLVGNPGYGKQIGKYGSRPVAPDRSWKDKLEQQSGFYSKLESSINKEGIRNPIFCNSIREGTFCRYGTSRLWIAKKHSLDVPCIIADYINRFDDLEILENDKDIRSKFIDQPDVIEWEPEFRIDACPHYHLKD